MLETLGKGNVVEVVEAIYRVTEGLVVLFLNKERVVRLVDSSDVELEIHTHQKMSEYVERRVAYVLDGDEVRADERDVVNLGERPDHSGVIDTGNENSEQVGKECRLFLKVEGEVLVVARNISMSM